MKRLVLLLLAAIAATPAAAADALPEAAQRLLAALPGHWQGELEYRDYQKPDKRVHLPTWIDASAESASGVSLGYRYDDGPGKTVTDRESLSLGEGQITIGEERYRISAASLVGENGGHLVLEREGRDDDKPARIRLSLDYTPTTLEWLKETTSDGPDYAFRHRYRLHKNP